VQEARQEVRVLRGLVRTWVKDWRNGGQERQPTRVKFEIRWGSEGVRVGDVIRGCGAWEREVLGVVNVELEKGVVGFEPEWEVDFLVEVEGLEFVFGVCSLEDEKCAFAFMAWFAKDESVEEGEECVVEDDVSVGLAVILLENPDMEVDFLIRDFEEVGEFLLVVCWLEGENRIFAVVLGSVIEEGFCFVVVVKCFVRPVDSSVVDFDVALEVNWEELFNNEVATLVPVLTPSVNTLTKSTLQNDPPNSPGFPATKSTHPFWSNDAHLLSDGHALPAQSPQNVLSNTICMSWKWASMSQLPWKFAWGRDHVAVS
jgi:hypothetical protein